MEASAQLRLARRFVTALLSRDQDALRGCGRGRVLDLTVFRHSKSVGRNVTSHMGQPRNVQLLHGVMEVWENA